MVTSRARVKIDFTTRLSYNVNKKPFQTHISIIYYMQTTFQTTTIHHQTNQVLQPNLSSAVAHSSISLPSPFLSNRSLFSHSHLGFLFCRCVQACQSSVHGFLSQNVLSGSGLEQITCRAVQERGKSRTGWCPVALPPLP
jgi:hypothetical protein